MFVKLTSGLLVWLFSLQKYERVHSLCTSQEGMWSEGVKQSASAILMLTALAPFLMKMGASMHS